MTLKQVAENHGLTPEGVDYALRQYQIVLCEITHGMLSKLSYDAHDVIRYAQERWCDTCELKESNGWISVKDRLPVETHSLFWPWRDSAKWNKAMWKEQSDKVIVAILLKDGTRIVRTGETHDGKWHTDVSMTLVPVVTHWMPFPELPKEGFK